MMMGNEQGLAQQAAGQVPQGMEETEAGEGQMPQGMSQEEIMKLVNEIARLLQNGASEKELAAQGVPEELIDMAMKMVGQIDPDDQGEKEPSMVNNSMGQQGLAQMAAQG